MAGQEISPGLKVHEIVNGADVTTWDLAWVQGVTPWDNGEVQLSLKEAVESKVMQLPSQGKALVPGCGSGYDLIYISSTLGFETLGLDVSETAFKRANSLIGRAKAEIPALNATIQLADFFKFDVPEDMRFDLIYDHTFFVAIHPTTRKDWGTQMAKLIKPGGYLVTVIYPIIAQVDFGPPYFVRPDHYDEPLGSNFVKVLDKVPEVSSPSHAGKEHLIVWKRI